MGLRPVWACGVMQVPAAAPTPQRSRRRTPSPPWSPHRACKTPIEYVQSGETLPPDSLYQFSIDLYKGAEYGGSVAPRIITTVTNVGAEQGELRLGTAAQVSSDIGGVRKVDTE